MAAPTGVASPRIVVRGLDRDRPDTVRNLCGSALVTLDMPTGTLRARSRREYLSSAALWSTLAALLFALTDVGGVVAQVQAPGVGATSAQRAEGFGDVPAAIQDAMRRWLFDPSLLQTPAFLATEARVAEIGRRAKTPEEFVREFNDVWRAGPVSHVQLQVARATAAETAATLDAMRVGGRGARLEWRGEVAILSVTTMMGVDTIEQIDAAFDEIVRRPALAVIVDLRANEGGAFAGASLVGHLIAAPVDAGAFVSQKWAREMARPPVRADADGAPWTGHSLTAFWRDVQNRRLTRIQFTPLMPHYAGPVFVLVNGKTASAAEMTVDALKAADRATVIGERTAGRMLSQKMYDLPHGLQLSLPIADYYSWTRGRLEGIGVTPDVPANAAAAMDVAFDRIAAK